MATRKVVRRSSKALSSENRSLKERRKLDDDVTTAGRLLHRKNLVKKMWKVFGTTSTLRLGGIWNSSDFIKLKPNKSSGLSYKRFVGQMKKKIGLRPKDMLDFVYSKDRGEYIGRIRIVAGVVVFGTSDIFFNIRKPGIINALTKVARY